RERVRRLHRRVVGRRTGSKERRQGARASLEEGRPHSVSIALRAVGRLRRSSGSFARRRDLRRWIACFGSERYVTPGSHVVRTVLSGHDEQPPVVVEAGATRSVAVLPPAQQPTPDPNPPSSPPIAPNAMPAEAPVQPPASGGWSPLVFVASAALATTA